MSRFAVVSALFAACSAPTRTSTPVPPPPADAAVVVDGAVDAPPALVTEADYELPVAGAPVNECRPAPTKKQPAFKRKTYDFNPMLVRPLRHGPTMAERPYVGTDVTYDNARGVFFSRSAEVIECWRWASARGAKETTLAVELTLDVRGSTSGVAISSAQIGDDELIACVKDMLAPPSWGQPRARATRVHAYLAFNSDMAPPAKAPRRPKPPKPAKAPARTVVCPAGSQDSDEVFLPILFVTNFDDRRPEAKGLYLPRGFGCDGRNREVDKAAIRISLRSQQGAFDGCYADALARSPALVGDMGATLLFDSSGYARDVEVAGAGDDALHRCFKTALEALWVVPYYMGQEIKVNLAFTLEPTRPTSADPNVLLEAGDYDAALAEWVNVLRAPHLPYQGCLAHVGILRAMTFVAPWLDDDRIRTVIGNLAQSVLALPEAEARSCVTTAGDLLRQYTRMDTYLTQPPDHSSMRHLERYEAVLPLAGFFEWGLKLRWYYGYYLLRTDRSSEAEDLFAELAKNPDLTSWFDARAKRPDMIHDACVR